MYRCAKCGEPYKNGNERTFQCDKCASWIFVKERPNEKKTHKSD